MPETHALTRTNPKGVPFIGHCMNCGQENLPITAAREPCENLAERTQDESLLLAIMGDDDA